MISNIETAIYPLPTVTKKVELFKGAVFDVAELAEQLKASDSHDILFKKSGLDSLEKYHKKSKKMKGCVASVHPKDVGIGFFPKL